MAAAVQLEIHAPTEHLTFDVEGDFVPRILSAYDDTDHLSEVQYEWRLTGCRLVSATTSAPVVTLWARIRAFVARWTSVSAPPEYVRLVTGVGTADVTAAGGRTLTFVDASPPRIEASSGDWADDGYEAGMAVRVVGGNNAGIYTLATVTADTLTLDAADELTDEGPVSSAVTVSARHVLDQLGGTASWDRLRLEELEGTQDPVVPQQSWRGSATFDLLVTAVQRNEDARGVTSIEQVVEESFPAGLRVLTWRTRVRTKEGTDAVALAKLYGRIPDSVLAAGNYVVETDGPDGIDWVKLDADETLTGGARVSTDVEAVSRIREVDGPSTGVSEPGGLSDASYVETVERAGDEVVTTYSATAEGPGYLDWVQDQAPSEFTRSVLEDRQSERRATGTWTHVETVTDDQGREFTTLVTAAVTGGRAAKGWWPIADGGAPVRKTGALLPARLELTVELRRVGGEGTREELPWPPLLRAPWELDYLASVEGEPYRERAVAESAQTVWRRSARLVYDADHMPEEPPLDGIEEGERVPFYGALTLPGGAP